MEMLHKLLNEYPIPSSADLLMAAPKIEVQIALALIHTFIWYILINEIFVPILVLIISNLKTKKRFLAMNRKTFKKAIQWDIGDDEDEQMLAVARIDAAMMQHLVCATLLFPSAFGFGYLFPDGVASAMACQALLCELGWEISDTLLRIYEIIFGGERGRKMNPLSLMMTLMAHHTAAFLIVIPMNIYYPNYSLFHEGICVIEFGIFVVFSCQQHGFTLDINTQEGLTRMKILCTIVFVNVLWSRVIRYAYVWASTLMMAYEDENWLVLKCMATPTICLTLFNLVVLKDSTDRFMKFAFMQIKKGPETYIKKIDDIKELVKKNGSSDSKLKSRKRIPSASAEDIFTDY